jgi:hypothetical protein
VPKRTQEIFWEKSDFSNRAQGAQEIFGKNRIYFEIQWSGNFRFRVLLLSPVAHNSAFALKNGWQSRRT